MTSFNLAFIILSLHILATISIAYAQTCQDSTERFQITLDDGTQRLKGCYTASKNPWEQCEKIEMMFNCPKTCGNCPGDIKCKVKADLQFPQDDSFKGFHSDFVKVQREGQSQICYSGNDRTDWGCSHIGGDAYVEGTGDFFRKAASSARVYDARNAKLTIGVSHRFSEKEVLQESDGNVLGRSNLIIRVNGSMSTGGSLRHNRNTYKHTHDGFDQVNALNRNIGFVNPLYNGDYFVDIVCDNSCNCSITKRNAECRLKAQLKFPKVDETDYHGFHKDV